MFNLKRDKISIFFSMLFILTIINNLNAGFWGALGQALNGISEYNDRNEREAIAEQARLEAEREAAKRQAEVDRIKQAKVKRDRETLQALGVIFLCIGSAAVYGIDVVVDKIAATVSNTQEQKHNAKLTIYGCCALGTCLLLYNSYK